MNTDNAAAGCEPWCVTAAVVVFDCSFSFFCSRKNALKKRRRQRQQRNGPAVVAAWPLSLDDNENVSRFSLIPTGASVRVLLDGRRVITYCPRVRCCSSLPAVRRRDIKSSPLVRPLIFIIYFFLQFFIFFVFSVPSSDPHAYRDENDFHPLQNDDLTRRRVWCRTRFVICPLEKRSWRRTFRPTAVYVTSR